MDMEWAPYEKLQQSCSCLGFVIDMSFLLDINTLIVRLMCAKNVYKGRLRSTYYRTKTHC